MAPNRNWNESSQPRSPRFGALTLQEVTPFADFLHGVQSVAFSPDGRTLASCGDRRVKLWSRETLQEILTLGRFTSTTGWAMFSSDGTCLSTNSQDDRVHLWRAPSLLEIEAAEADEKRGPQQ